MDYRLPLVDYFMMSEKEKDFHNKELIGKDQGKLSL